MDDLNVYGSSFTITTPRCSCCGDPHENLQAKPLPTPSLDGFDYWTICPKVGEVIYFRKLPEGE